MKSDQLDKLAAALCKAQGQIKVAIKDSANPFFKSKFADLNSVWDACRDALQANGLSVAQVPTTDDDGKPALETILLHSSGQWISGVVPVAPVKNDPQGLGSAITYMRRYALQSVIGVCADVDDDGEAAHGRGNNKKQDSHGVAQKKKPEWLPDQLTEAGGYKASIMEFGEVAEKEFNELWRRMAYNPPSETIDELSALLAKWRANQ